MRKLSILIGLFVGLGIRYLPEIGIENAPGQVVTTTHEGVFTVYMILAVAYISYIAIKAAKDETKHETQTKSEGVKRLWH